MPAEGGKTVEEQLAKLRKDITWLRVALIVALVAVALVAVAVLQMREKESVGPATTLRAVGASQFTLLEGLEKRVPKGVDKVEKTRVRAQLGLRDGVPRLELLDESGKPFWSTPAPEPTEPPSKEGPTVKEPTTE